jgi:hypothetical protein
MAAPRRAARILSSLACACVLALGCATPRGETAPRPTIAPQPTTPAARRAPDAYVEALVRRAHAQGLAQRAQWLRLLHYRQGMFGAGFLGGGYASEADGDGFFLSPRGKFDPQAELDATIRGVFAPMSDVHERKSRMLGQGEERGPNAHPACQFPARLAFLYQALAFDPSKLPVQRCPMLEQFLSELDAQSVTLVFSAYYLNNPASAFGHTFLRFNRAHTLATGERRELLDYGIDYSADVDTGNSVVYAIKGLTGLFPGTFKRIPYFYKVREYNDYESRDLWEYEINLTPAQLALLSAHLWELGHTYFDYYYLSENCSYHILALLEVANPDLSLMDHVSSPVIPADTIKALYANPGLVRSERYRPALRKQLEARLSRLDGDERALVEELGHDPEAPLPAGLSAARKVAVLDAAADFVDVLYARQLIDKSDAAAAAKKQRLLERRSEILQPSAPLSLETPWQQAPEHGHGSHRLGLGAAVQRGEFAPTLDFRLALHDLADPTPGYLELSSIEFLRARLQLWSSGRIQLDDGVLFGVTSLSVQSRFQRRLSWHFELGATTLEDRACDQCLAGQMTGGLGPTFGFWDNALLFFVTADAAVQWTPAIAGLGESHFRLGLGPNGGLRLRFTPQLIALVAGHWWWLPAQSPAGTYRVDATLRWQWLEGLATGLEGRAMPDGLEGQLIAFAYF